MAKRRAIRPKLFQSNEATKKYMDNFAHNKVQSVLDGAMKSIEKAKPDNVEIVRKPKYIKVTEDRMRKIGVIDLKPYFAKSPHRKQSKGGGWYLTVPIKRTKRSMSRRMYEQLRSIPLETGQEKKTVISDYLYDRRRESDATMLNYKPRSKNITKIRTGKNRHEYVAFRRVSDKSPINSWILNRDKVNVKDTSKTFVSNVNRVMKWKMKNS